DNVQGVCRSRRTEREGGDPRRSRTGSSPRVRPGAGLRRPRRRGARCCHRAPDSGRHRPARGSPGAPMKLIFEESQAGRRGGELPRYELPSAGVPEELRRREAPRLPEIAEPEIVRHFTELSSRNFGIDTGFYPLGSCTMKYNPRVNERLAMLPGFRDLHPLQDEDAIQGALELMWRLQQALIEVSGLDACTLQPAAGSQGELTGMLMMRASFVTRGVGDCYVPITPATM